METASEVPTTGKHKHRRKKRRRDYIAPGFGVFAIFVVIAAGWWQHRHRKALHEVDEAELRAQLSEALTHGLSLTDAWIAMVRRDFDCVHVPPDTFPDFQTFLCDRSDPMPSGKPVQWQVIVKGDKKDGRLVDYVLIRR